MPRYKKDSHPQPDLPPLPNAVFESMHLKTEKINGYFEGRMKQAFKRNPDFDCSKEELYSLGLLEEPVYEYFQYTSSGRLETDAQNAMGKDAVKVYLEDVPVGYITRSQRRQVQKLLDEKRIKNICVQVQGGQYKRLLVKHGHEGTSAQDYDCVRSSSPFECEVTVNYYKTQK